MRNLLLDIQVLLLGQKNVIDIYKKKQTKKSKISNACK